MTQRILTAELFAKWINVRGNRYYLGENKNEYEVMSEGKNRDWYRVAFGKSEERNSRFRPRHRRDNTIRTELEEFGCVAVHVERSGWE